MKILIIIIFFQSAFSCTIKLTETQINTTTSSNINALHYYKSVAFYTNFNVQIRNKKLITTTIDGHSTTIIIPVSGTNNYLYQVTDAVYVQINVHTGKATQKITDGNFFSKEKILNYYDINTKKRYLKLSTTRNTNGFPIVVFIGASHT